MLQIPKLEQNEPRLPYYTDISGNNFTVTMLVLELRKLRPVFIPFQVLYHYFTLFSSRNFCKRLIFFSMVFVLFFSFHSGFQSLIFSRLFNEDHAPWTLLWGHEILKKEVQCCMNPFLWHTGGQQGLVQWINIAKFEIEKFLSWWTKLMILHIDKR